MMGWAQPLVIEVHDRTDLILNCQNALDPHTHESHSDRTVLSGPQIRVRN